MHGTVFLFSKTRFLAVYNDTAGEYLAIAALRDGTIGVVTPIQNEAANRLGFTWWTLQQR
jgi:hypothetical protein